MSPALWLLLVNAKDACQSHEAPAPAKYERGFEQCAIVVPEIRKAMEREWQKIDEGQKRRDEETIAKAEAALAEQNGVSGKPIDWSKFTVDTERAAARAAQGKGQ